MQNANGKDRRTLIKIPYYPTPKKLLEDLVKSEGWPYRANKDSYLLRDRALISVIYLGGLRISEALRLCEDQFIQHESYIEVQAIRLSKLKKKGLQRKTEFREARLPLESDRSGFTKIVLDYLENMQKGERLFKFKNQRAWQIITATLPNLTTHWLRAYCENYLYENWNSDLLAVSDYVKVDSRTLQQYIRRRYIEKPIV